MKQTRSVALARLSCPEFVQFFRYEWLAMQTVSMVAHRLYGELVRLSSFKTGEVLTSYAQLLALLTPDQPAHGRPSPAPTLKQVRAALDELQAVDLVSRNKAANEQSGRLTLHLEPRESARSRNANLGRAKGRVEEAKNFLENNKLAQSVHRKRAGFRAGGSRGKSFTTPPPQISDELSTGQGPTPPEPDEPPGPISLSPGGEKIGPPRGPDTRPAGAGRAPRLKVVATMDGGIDWNTGERRVLQAVELAKAPPVSQTTQAMRERLRNAASAPPGGQADAPPGEAPPPSARIRRPRNTVLKDEAATSGNASAPAGHPAEPPEGPQGASNGVGHA